MNELELKPPKNNSHQYDLELKKLCKIGGYTCIIFLIYTISILPLLFTIGGYPTTAEECFAMLQENRIVGLLRLDLLTIVFIPLYYVIVLGIYAAFRKTNLAYATLTTLLAFAGITLILATPSVLSLLDLSDKFALATTEAERAQILAAGEAIISSDLWHGTGAFIGGVLAESSYVFISILMIRTKTFNQSIGYIGLITHSLDLLHIFVGFYSKDVAAILMVIAGILYVPWLLLLGRRLVQLGKN